jgi:hypothetical protein
MTISGIRMSDATGRNKREALENKMLDRHTNKSAQ